MNIRLTIEDLADDFPNFEVAVVLASSLDISEQRPGGLDTLIEQRETACRDRFPDIPLSEIEGIAAWRQAYRQFGIKKTSYRSSVERLVKNVLADRRLPAINSFVDCYNAVSLDHVLPIGADDADRMETDAAFRYARDDDTFFPLGKPDAENDPPKSGEVVLASGSNVLCRRWNWYQDARSPITSTTQYALITIQSNGWGDVREATDDLFQLLDRFCGAQCSMAIASAQTPVVSLASA